MINKRLRYIRLKLNRKITLDFFNQFAGEIFEDRNEDIEKTKNIPSEPVKNPEIAIFQREKALGDIEDLDEDQKSQWQNYWLGFCMSDKSNYVFSIISAECVDINREEDLIQIITGDIISNYLSSEAEKYYMSACIDFLLRRYNWVGAGRLFFKHPRKIRWNLVISWNLFKIFFPRILSSILVGIILIASSQELMDFGAEISKGSLFNYSLIFTFFLSFFYFFFECCDVIRGSLPKNQFNSKIIFRISLISLWGFGLSIVFSYILTSIHLLHSDLVTDFNWKFVLFDASFSFFIGILIQLLWEDKTVTEPL